MYTSVNFKTKRELKEAVASGRKISIYQPGPFSGRDTNGGKFYVEGPHYPQPHKWYAQVIVQDGYITSVK